MRPGAEIRRGRAIAALSIIHVRRNDASARIVEANAELLRFVFLPLTGGGLGELDTGAELLPLLVRQNERRGPDLRDLCIRDDAVGIAWGRMG
jgi:hypothetical protein